MDTPEQAAQENPASPVDSGERKRRGWSETSKTLIICALIAAVAGIIAKDREQERTKEIELAKIRQDAEIKKEQIRQQQEYESRVRQEELQRLAQQQSAAQRQRILTFYSAVLARLDQADAVWWKRPTTQGSDAALAQYDRMQLIPIYAEAQKLISENMELVSLSPSMRIAMSEFGRCVATYDFSRYGSTPHGNLRYTLQWAVQAMSQRQ